MAKPVPPLTKTDHFRGDLKAPLKMIEYGDYQCPHCGAAYPVVKKLLDEVGDQVCFIFRNFPLSAAHPQAIPAALAAEAAGKQDKYWEMHDKIFENQDALEDNDLLSYAEELGLDMDQFQKDWESKELASKVEKDFMGGVRSGVSGTPTFFIGEKKYVEVTDYETLREAVTLALEE